MTVEGAPRQAETDLLALLGAARPEPDRNGRPPDDGQLREILASVVSVPDHGSLRPWRFCVVRGQARDRFGQALLDGLVGERGPELPESVTTKMRNKAYAAPCQVVLIASPVVGSNVPRWEQVASASCTGYAIVLAASSLGLGAVWKSAAVLHTAPVRALFDLDEHEELLGWVNLGTPREDEPTSRRDPGALADRVSELEA